MGVTSDEGSHGGSATARSSADGTTGRDLAGKVVVVAGATGAAGPSIVQRLSAAGAVVIAAGHRIEAVQRVVDDANTGSLSHRSTASAPPDDRGPVHGAVVDLLDDDATRAWGAEVLAEHGQVDGLVHLVGGWRGGASVVDMDLADWTFLNDVLIRTLQHTTRAFDRALAASSNGRLVLVSALQAGKPSAKNAAYAAAKAAAETWTMALADGYDGSATAAVVLRIKALLTPAMREAKPDAGFSGYTTVADLADQVHDLWLTPADQLNGQRLCLI